MEHWWNDTDRGKLSMEHWCNDTDRGKLSMEHWWNDTDRGKLSMEHWWNDNDWVKLSKEHWWNDIERRKSKAITGPSTISSTMHLTWTCLRMNSGLRGDMTVKNCRNCCTA
jgi:hypothetical protein